MTSELTLSFTGNDSNLSVIQASFLPELILEEDYDYSCALLDLFIKKHDTFKWDKVLKTDLIDVNCDIILGSYINGVVKQTIHQPQLHHMSTRIQLLKSQDISTIFPLNRII